MSLQEMCGDYDRKGALELLSGITRCTKETRMVLDKIKEYVTHSDFEEAEGAAAEYAAKLPHDDIVIDGLDMGKGLERYGGDREVYWKILRSYAVNIGKMLKTIEVISEERLKDYKITVHGIKGASYDIFAAQIGDAAKALELAAIDGDFGFISKHHPAFLEAAQKLISGIEGALAVIAAKNPKPKKSKPESELLLKMLAACRQYDMDGVDAAMEKIDRYHYEDDGGLTDWLRDNVSLMKFTQIIERLSALDL
jgi:hypothetical protein